MLRKTIREVLPMTPARTLYVASLYNKSYYMEFLLERHYTSGVRFKVAYVEAASERGLERVGNSSILLDTREPNTAYLQVLKSFRPSYGIGSALLCSMEEEAGKWGVGEIEAWVRISPEGEHLAEFLIKRGYTRVECDPHLMRKKI
jgi:hypothetical protein